MHRLPALFVLVACTTTAPATAPVPDAPVPCDYVSCAAGAALACCTATYAGSQTISAALARPSDPGPFWGSGSWLWNDPGFLVYPVSLPVGCRLVSWAARVEKASAAFFHGELVTVIDGEQHPIGPLVTVGGVPAGFYTLEGVINQPVAARQDYAIRVMRGGAPVLITDRAFWAETHYECPVPGAL